MARNRPAFERAVNGACWDDARVERSGFWSAPWIEYEAPLRPLEWGRNTYVVLAVEPSLADAATQAGTRRVEGLIDQHEVNLGINRADVSTDPFLYVGAGLRRRLDVSVGDLVGVRLRPADPDEVLVPDDVLTALDTARAVEAFDDLRPAERRRRLASIDDAVQEATRLRRIDALVRELSS